MQTILKVLVLSIILNSCGPTVNREQAIQFRETISEIIETNRALRQEFFDATTEIVSELTLNPNCTIDFEKISNLLALAKESNAEARSKLEMVNEIDEDINYKSNTEAYYVAEQDVFDNCANWFEILQQSRDAWQNEETFDSVFEKLKIMKERELILNRSMKDFNEKYEL